MVHCQLILGWKILADHVHQPSTHLKVRSILPSTVQRLYVQNIPAAVVVQDSLLTHSFYLFSILHDQEEDCLHYMTKLHVEDFDDVKTGYRISFYFKENPYFENDIITKEFHLAAENQTSTDFTQTSTSTTIKWKEGKDLLKEQQSKPQNKKRDIEHKSFFDWFCDNADPVNDDLAELIKDDIWPNPLQYFLVPDIGVYNDEESSEGDSDEGEEEEDEDDDVEQDDAE